MEAASVYMGCYRRPPLRLVPVDGSPQAFGEVDLGPEPKLSFCLAGVELSAGLSVRLSGIPLDPTAKTSRVGNPLDELADANLEGRTKVHRLRLGVALGCLGNPLGSVFHVQKL